MEVSYIIVILAFLLWILSSIMSFFWFLFMCYRIGKNEEKYINSFNFKTDKDVGWMLLTWPFKFIKIFFKLPSIINYIFIGFMLYKRKEI